MRSLSLFVLLATASVAHAQYNVPSQATGDSARVEIVDEASSQVIAVDPKAPTKLGYEVGASLDFLTRDRAPGESALKFTDVVLFRVHGLMSIGRRVELFGGVDLLPKQPSFTDELVWQGAMVGTRVSFTKKLSAYVRGQGGPALGRDGYWAIGEIAARSQLHLAERVLFWESTLGGTYTQLFPDDDDRIKLWQTELLAQSGIAIRERRGFFAAWLTFGFHFPLAVGRELDPQTRVSVQLGMLIGVTKALDFFAEIQILDRGDLQDPRTTLPILAGGFDQNRFVFGFNRRFGTRRR